MKRMAAIVSFNVGAAGKFCLSTIRTVNDQAKWTHFDKVKRTHPLSGFIRVLIVLGTPLSFFSGCS
jgi:hypothetical protein